MNEEDDFLSVVIRDMLDERDREERLRDREARRGELEKLLRLLRLRAAHLAAEALADQLGKERLYRLEQEKEALLQAERHRKETEGRRLLIAAAKLYLEAETSPAERTKEWERALSWAAGDTGKPVRAEFALKTPMCGIAFLLSDLAKVRAKFWQEQWVEPEVSGMSPDTGMCFYLWAYGTGLSFARSRLVSVGIQVDWCQKEVGEVLVPLPEK